MNRKTKYCKSKNKTQHTTHYLIQ